MNMLQRKDRPGAAPDDHAQLVPRKGLYLVVWTGSAGPGEPVVTATSKPQPFDAAMTLFGGMAGFPLFRPQCAHRLRVMSEHEAGQWPEVTAARGEVTRSAGGASR